MNYVFGIRELDKVYSQALRPGSLIVIAGHPGSGKTTFAVTISYSNALLGKKTLYLTFQEDKNKLYFVMKDLGMDLISIENKGLFKFVKIPITLDMKGFIDWVNKLVDEYKPDILVIDSINAILGSVDEKEQRAWLQNFFYSILQRENGLTILISELPYGSEKLKLGSIEFVADAIFILKHRIEDRVLVRIMEIRKTRGSPITVAEFPFSILSGKGLEIYLPLYLEEIPYEGEKIALPFKTLRDKVSDHVHRGFVMYFAYPPDARNWIPYGILFGFLLIHDMKAFIVSYNYPDSHIREFLLGKLSELGLDKELGEKIIDERVIIKGINPYAYSISQIYAIESSLIEEKTVRNKIDIVVFEDVGTIDYRGSEYLRYLGNQLFLLKKYGLIVFRIGSIIDETHYRVNSAISDLIFRFIPEYRDRDVVYTKIYVWRRRNLNPSIISQEEINEMVDELREILRGKFMVKK